MLEWAECVEKGTSQPEQLSSHEQLSVALSWLTPWTLVSQYPFKLRPRLLIVANGGSSLYSKCRVI